MSVARPAPKTTNTNAFLPHGIVHGKKNVKMIEITYRRNLESDYTEHIRELNKGFDYENNRNDYWLAPEFSLLYGSPLYEGASEDQRRALNHLYWSCFYNYTIGGEVSTMVYNQLTCAALYHLGGFGTLCRELDMETGQERDHTEAFQKLGRETELALMGETIFERPLPHYLEGGIIHPQGQTDRLQLWQNTQALVFAGAMGYSPFIATQYYVLRGMRNIQLKVKEYQHSQYHEQLLKSEQFVPAPTAVAHYHYSDEAFHTATSQLICHEVYKDFRKPTTLEKFAANRGIQVTQKTMNWLSGAVPGIFSPDRHYIPLVYRMLRTRLFNMTHDDAMEMTQRCFCEEHEGHHVAAKYHQRALDDNRGYIADLDYIWKSNRELRLMQEASIARTVQDNQRAFKRFASSSRRYGNGYVEDSTYDHRDPRYADNSL